MLPRDTQRQHLDSSSEDIDPEVGAPDFWVRQYQKELGTPNLNHLSAIPGVPRGWSQHTWRCLGYLV